MESADRGAAWLETDEGQTWDLRGNCRIGRDPGNEIFIDEPKASRQHAAIHSQGDAEFWLVDLGSRNGTFRNEERVFYPVQLKHDDRLSIGGITLRFHHPASTPTDSSGGVGLPTVLEMQERKTWLVIADLDGFTKLSRKTPAPELAVKVGGWFQECLGLLQKRGGHISKYLGDGFLACWPGSADAIPKVAQALGDFHRIRQAGSLKFRLAVHYGPVTFGGQSAFGEESMFGPELNFTFRLEKLAGKLGLANCASESAQRLLAAHLPIEPVPGEHQLGGFDDLHRCYRWSLPE
jgi:adenylate cyclase